MEPVNISITTGKETITVTVDSDAVKVARAPNSNDDDKKAAADDYDQPMDNDNSSRASSSAVSLGPFMQTPEWQKKFGTPNSIDTRAPPSPGSWGKKKQMSPLKMKEAAPTKSSPTLEEKLAKFDPPAVSFEPSAHQAES